VRTLVVVAVCGVVAGCSVHRTPAWERAKLVAVDPPTDELVHRSREAFRRGVRLRGAASLAALDDAVTFAELAMYQDNQLFRDKVRRRERPSWLFAAPTREQLPALVAYGEALLEWSRRRGVGTLLEEQDRIREALQRAWRLDRDFDHAAPDRLLGIFFSVLPVGYGADYMHAREHFEAAIAADPGYLPSKMAYAEELAARTGDEQLYRRLVEEVADADPGKLPPPEEINREAMERALSLRMRMIR
jgi:hypothetical protein